MTSKPRTRPRTPLEQARDDVAHAARRGDPPEEIAALRLELERLKVGDHARAIDDAGSRGVIHIDAETKELLARLWQYPPAPGDEPAEPAESADAWAAS